MYSPTMSSGPPPSVRVLYMCMFVHLTLAPGGGTVPQMSVPRSVRLSGLQQVMWSQPCLASYWEVSVHAKMAVFLHPLHCSLSLPQSSFELCTL